MSLYGSTFHVTPVDLCIIFQCMLYISCFMYCGNKIVSSVATHMLRDKRHGLANSLSPAYCLYVATHMLKDKPHGLANSLSPAYCLYVATHMEKDKPHGLADSLSPAYCLYVATHMLKDKPHGLAKLVYSHLLTTYGL